MTVKTRTHIFRLQDGLHKCTFTFFNPDNIFDMMTVGGSFPRLEVKISDYEPVSIAYTYWNAPRKKKRVLCWEIYEDYM